MSVRYDQYDNAVRVLTSAYFRENKPMYQLSLLFNDLQHDLVIAASKVASRNELKKSCIHLLMAFLRVILAEYNMLRPYQNKYEYGVSGGNHDFEASRLAFCMEPTFPRFCELLGKPNSFLRWTHLILSITYSLQTNLFPRLTREGGLAVDKLTPETVSQNEDILRGTRLLLYGFLFSRLSMALGRNPDVGETRFRIESCLFLAVLSFYSDYLQVKENLRALQAKKADLKSWEDLYTQVNSLYIHQGSRWFTSLTIHAPGGRSNQQVPLKAFFSPAAAGPVHELIASKFIYPYNSALAANDSINIDEIMSALNNLDSLYYRMNSWFFRNITHNLQRVSAKVAKYKDKFFLWSNYVSLFATSKYVQSAVVTGIAAYSLIAYTPETVSSKVRYVVLSLAALGTLPAVLAARTALSIGFKDRELIKPERKELVNEVPLAIAQGAPYLEEVTKPDGSKRVDLIIILPRYRPQASKEGQPEVWTLQSGGGSNDFILSQDVQQLKIKMQTGGHLRNQLPQEMQDYIRKQMKVNANGTKQKGGAEDVVEDPDIPQNYIRRRIADPEGTDPATAEIDPNTGEVLANFPLPSLATQGLQSMFVVDTADSGISKPIQDDPSAEVSTAGTNFTPPEILLDQPSNHVMTAEEVNRVAQDEHIPLPPVIPDVRAAAPVQMYHPMTSRLRSRSRSRVQRRNRRGSNSRKRSGRRRARSRSKPRSRSRSRSRSRAKSHY